MTSAESGIALLRSHDLLEATHPFHPWRGRVFRVRSVLTAGCMPVLRRAGLGSAAAGLPEFMNRGIRVRDFRITELRRKTFPEPPTATCTEHVHFDVRQYNGISWEAGKETDLRVKFFRRIQTIAPRPFRPVRPGILHIPFIAEHPTNCRRFPVSRHPPENVSWPEEFTTHLVFRLPCGHRHPFPDRIDGTLRMSSIRFLAILVGDEWHVYALLQEATVEISIVPNLSALGS